MTLKFWHKNPPVEMIQNRKEGYFNFERISSYYRWRDGDTEFQQINDQTWSDLDMDEVFMFTDRTHSRPGQQFLYYLIRTIPKHDRAVQIAQMTRTLNANPVATKELVKALQGINTNGSYFIINLFSGRQILKPKWFWFVYFLFALTIASMVGMFIFQQLALVFLVCLIVNFILHYWNKGKLMGYSNAITQIYHFYQACERLAPFTFELGDDNGFNLAKKKLRTLARKALLLRAEDNEGGDLTVVANLVAQLIKATFLIEPLVLFHLSNMIRKNKEAIALLFERIGFADACLSIHALRQTTTQTKPTINEGGDLAAVACFHPLITDPIPNTVHVSKKDSLLISGSNMSGKTTFIRTIGINALLAQTIDLAFASSWSMPKMKIFSAIRIVDDLINNASFYQKEVEMIKESEASGRCLFLIDELFKGTNSIERIAAGAAVLDHLSNNQHLVCASTHDLALINLVSKAYISYHFTETEDDNTLKFDYKLKEGQLQNTNAIRVLELNGFPKTVTERARNLTLNLQ